MRRAWLIAVALVGAACTPADTSRTSPTPEATTSASVSASAAPLPTASRSSVDFVLQEYPVTRGQGPHDVAPARDGGIWYTAQLSGELGWLDPKFGVTKALKLGPGSAPHGVIVGPDGAPWVTDGGLNAIVDHYAQAIASEYSPM